MAGRVNTKFVAILSVSLLALFCVVAVVGYTQLKNRAPKWVQKGDALVAQGKYDEAAKLYERAVGKDRTRVEWLQKWRDALVKTTPDNRARYEEQYRFYLNILRTLAMLQAKDVAAQLAYVKEYDLGVRSSGAVSREQMENMIKEIGERLRDVDPDAPGIGELRRYRGAAGVDLMTVIRVEDEVRDLAKEDIESALKENPNDATARILELRWQLAEAERYRAERRPELEAGPREQAVVLIKALEKDFPKNPEVLLAVYAAKQSDRLRSAVSAEDRREIIFSSRNEVLSLVDTALSIPVDELALDQVDRIVATGLRIAGKDAIPPLTALVDRLIEKHPNDARILLNKGIIYQESEQLDEAITQFQKVVDLPDMPVSLDGLLLSGRQMTAMAFQVDTAIMQWNMAQDDETRIAALNRAKEYREKLRAEAGVRGRDVLLLRDAKIAYAEKKYDETVAKLSELRSLPSSAGRSLETLQLLAQALQLQQANGEAKLVLEEMLEQAPSLAWAHASLGEVNMRLGDLEAARVSYARASELEPENTNFAQRLASIRSALGTAEGDDRADPVISGIMSARKLRDDGDLVGSRVKLEALRAAHPDNRQVFNELINLDMREGLREDAIKKVEEVLAKYPDDEGLRRMLASLKEEDPLKAALLIIDGMDVSDGQKALERFNVYVQRRMQDEAAAALAEAERLEPENPRVLDMAFVVALGQKDYDKAQRLAETAARLDVDQLGGLLYQGRLELVEGQEKPEKMDAAIRTFETAVKRVPYNPTVRKLLAQAYTRAGRPLEALEAYKRAYEGKPDDLTIARDYAALLLNQNRGAEALTVVAPKTGILRFFPANTEMLNLWMDLESRFGDRALALTARQEMLRLDPSNRTNTLSLAQLLVDEKKWEEATKLIDEIQKDPEVNKLAVARIRANMLSRQGDVDGGVQAIQNAIDQGVGDGQQTSAWLLMADYLQRNDRLDEAATAMKKARETQTPGVLEADRALGDLYFDIGNKRFNAAATAEDTGETEVSAQLQREGESHMTEATVYYEALIAGIQGRPEDLNVIRKRLCETYIRLKRYDDAQRIVVDLVKEEPENLQVLLLQGSIAAGKGDRRSARAFFDQAVTKNQNNSGAYMQRAIFNLSAEPDVRRSLLPDILQDLEQVCKLRPSYTTAWSRRYILMRENNQVEQAFAVLRQCVAANPNNDDMRLMLIRELAVSGRLDEMQTEIMKTVEERPLEHRWLRVGAGLLAMPGIERWRDAADLLEKFYTKEPKPENVSMLLDAHLRPGNVPSRARIQQLLVEFDKIYAADNLFDVMLKARARTFTGEEAAAERHLDEALKLIGGSGPGAQQFMNYLILAKDGAPKAMEWLAAKSKKSPLNPYLESLLISSRRGSEPPSQLIEPAKALVERAEDDVTRVEVLRLLSALYYQNESYQLAADSAREALSVLEKDPNHVRNPAYMEMTNNLAYTLVAQLDDPQGGLPYAQKAAELVPNSATVLDTLGWCHYKLKNYDQAIEVLTRASTMARDPEERFISTLHLGLSQAASGDKSAARRSLVEVERGAEQSRSAKQPDYMAKMETLRKAVE